VGTACDAQLRAHGEPHTARIDAADGDTVLIRFDSPVDQAAPGQSVCSTAVTRFSEAA